MLIMRFAIKVRGRSSFTLTAILTTLLIITGRQISFIKSATLEDAGDAEAKAADFLANFGYMEQSENVASSVAPEKLTQAIIEFQEFFNLNQTGVLDEETVQVMKLPRCGNPDKRRARERGADFISGSVAPKRRRREDAKNGGKWRRLQLTYKIRNYPKLYRSKQRDVDVVISNALNEWSRVTPIDFVKTTGNADINIDWAEKKHCNGRSFDGPGGTVAHAFFPEDGRVHFDDEESWVLSGNSEGMKLNIHQIALHELGHALGLEHKNDLNSIMHPTSLAVYDLRPTDIAAIQAIYGRRLDRQSPANPGTVNPQGSSLRRPNICKDPRIDAITMSNAGKVFVFKGDWYWLLNDEADAPVQGFPRLISKDWKGLPGSLDAALTFKSGKMYFFKSNKYWRFTDRRLDAGYPKLMSAGFPGIPNSPDGAFRWKNDKIFFFKGNQYWRFDWQEEAKVKADYPKPISSWRGVPSNINDVFVWKNSRTYFYKDEVYYKYNDDTDEVEQADPPFPRSISHWWFGCDEQLNVGLLDSVEDSVLEASAETSGFTETSELEINIADFRSNSSAENLSDNERDLDSF